ncbi:diguanylate cyclase [Escherichia coli]|nr:diguanylate cyclase [Escherichia coli]
MYFMGLDISPEELLKRIRNSFADFQKPEYIYDLGPYIISDGKCAKVTTEGDNFCDGIVSSIRISNIFERGIISLNNKYYIYYAHPISKRTSLISVVDPERYLALKEISQVNGKIYMSHFMISMIMKRKSRVMIF